MHFSPIYQTNGPGIRFCNMSELIQHSCAKFSLACYRFAAMSEISGLSRLLHILFQGRRQGRQPFYRYFFKSTEHGKSRQASDIISYHIISYHIISYHIYNYVYIYYIYYIYVYTIYYIIYILYIIYYIYIIYIYHGDSTNHSPQKR